MHSFWKPLDCPNCTFLRSEVIDSKIYDLYVHSESGLVQLIVANSELWDYVNLKENGEVLPMGCPH